MVIASFAAFIMFFFSENDDPICVFCCGIFNILVPDFLVIVGVSTL